MEIPEFVRDHDEEVEYRPITDFGLESDHARLCTAPSVVDPIPMYSMRCIA